MLHLSSWEHWRWLWEDTAGMPVTSTGRWWNLIPIGSPRPACTWTGWISCPPPRTSSSVTSSRASPGPLRWWGPSSPCSGAGCPPCYGSWAAFCSSAGCTITCPAWPLCATTASPWEAWLTSWSPPGPGLSCYPSSIFTCCSSPGLSAPSSPGP